METDDLIARLAADRAARPGPRIDLALAALGALAASLLVMLAFWGLRTDLLQALASAAFWMKAGYTAAVALAAWLILDRLARPGGRSPLGMALAAAAVVLVAALAARELALLPSDQWMAVVKGQSWSVCPARIALASAPGFLIAVLALRRAAPTRPALAGAAAGLLAGGLGATAYGLHCDETAAAFLAVWYTLGMLVWAVAGAVAGPRLLRW